MNYYDSICCFRNKSSEGYRILMEITNKCNENCVFCHWKDTTSLSLEQVKMIVNNLSIVKIKDIILTGGEPLLHSELYEILSWLKENRIDCDLCTNGIALNEENALILSEFLSEISVSLDSSKSLIYDELRGTKNGFEKVISGINILNRNKIDVHLTCVVNKKNQDEIEDIVELASALNVHSISFLGVITDVAKNKEQTQNIALDIHEKMQVMDVINGLRNVYSNVIINTKRLTECSGEVCRAGENILGITSDGKIMGCIMHRDSQFDIINEKLSIEMLNKLKINRNRC